MTKWRQNSSSERSELLQICRCMISPSPGIHSVFSTALFSPHTNESASRFCISSLSCSNNLNKQNQVMHSCYWDNRFLGSFAISHFAREKKQRPQCLREMPQRLLNITGSRVRECFSRTCTGFCLVCLSRWAWCHLDSRSLKSPTVKQPPYNPSLTVQSDLFNYPPLAAKPSNLAGWQVTTAPSNKQATYEFMWLLFSLIISQC